MVEYQGTYIEAVKLGTLGIINIVNCGFSRDTIITLPTWFKIKDNKLYTSSIFSLEERMGAEVGITNGNLQVYFPLSYSRLENLTGQVVVPLESF